MTKSKPHPVDVHVGRRLRSRRTILGMSQEELGEAVDVTFQQIQKYERGYNRIGSSRLYEFAKILKVDVSYFFQDYEEGDASTSNVTNTLAGEADTPSFEYTRSNNKEILTLIRAYYGISDERVRKKMLALIKSLANIEDTEEDFQQEAEEQRKALFAAAST